MRFKYLRFLIILAGGGGVTAMNADAGLDALTLSVQSLSRSAQISMRRHTKPADVTLNFGDWKGELNANVTLIYEFSNPHPRNKIASVKWESTWISDALFITDDTGRMLSEIRCRIANPTRLSGSGYLPINGYFSKLRFYGDDRACEDQAGPNGFDIKGLKLTVIYDWDDTGD